MTLEKLYSVEEAAVLLGGISKWTIHSWLSKGKLRKTKVGARTMIRESDLELFINDCNERTSPEAIRSTPLTEGGLA